MNILTNRPIELALAGLGAYGAATGATHKGELNNDRVLASGLLLTLSLTSAFLPQLNRIGGISSLVGRATALFNRFPPFSGHLDSVLQTGLRLGILGLCTIQTYHLLGGDMDTQVGKSETPYDSRKQWNYKAADRAAFRLLLGLSLGLTLNRVPHLLGITKP